MTNWKREREESGIRSRLETAGRWSFHFPDCGRNVCVAEPDRNLEEQEFRFGRTGQIGGACEMSELVVAMETVKRLSGD